MKHLNIAAGAALGGSLVGLSEALYRGVELIWSIAFYGTLWGLAGLGLAVLGMLLKRDLGFWTGMGLATSASALAIVRFIVKRDILVEDPSGGMKATLAALVVAGVLASVFFAAQKFAAASIPLFASATLVGLPIITLAFHTLDGNDDAIATVPTGTQLHGQGVIMLLVDTLRADVLGSYGATDHRGKPASPNLDAFAKEGIVYNDVTAQASWTKPTVASIMTSRHAAGHGAMSKVSVLPDGLPTLSEVYKQAGYKTAAVVTNYNLEEGFGFSQGFDHFRYLPPARYLGAPPRANRLAAYNVFRVIREKFFGFARKPEHFYRTAREVNAEGIVALDAIGNDNFFLWLHYMEPHDPFFSIDGPSYARVAMRHPKKELAAPMMDAYRDEVHRLDEALGELFAELKGRGLWDKTTIVLVSDHGEEFAEHDGYYHGTTLYQELIHVPLIIKGPKFTPGVHAHAARQIDVAPTLLAANELTAPAEWEGLNLLTQEAAPPTILSEEDHEGNQLTALRMGSQKVVFANADNPRGLAPVERYNLIADPGEQKQLATSEGEANALRKQLNTAVAASRAGGTPVANTRQLDADAEAQLRALGYIE